MRELLIHRSSAIWLLLMIATGLSWWLGTGRGVVETSGNPTAWAGLMLIAFVKVRWILLDFMELRTAPLVLRLLFEAWVVAVCGTIIVNYLIA